TPGHLIKQYRIKTYDEPLAGGTRLAFTSCNNDAHPLHRMPGASRGASCGGTTLKRFSTAAACALLLLTAFGLPAFADDPVTKKDVTDAKAAGDTAWMLVSTGLVLLMVPGLALFYGGMVRRKNVLGTMMHSMVALAIIGIQWFLFGYCLAFGDSHGGIIGWSSKYLGLNGVMSDELF